MAIDLYTATTNPGGSDSGWEARFCAHFQDASKHQWRVEIIDSKSSTTGFNWNLDEPVDFTLGADGFTLSHEGSPDNLHQSFIPSNCTIDFHIDTEQHERLFTQLNSSNSDDHRFGIVIYRFTGGSVLSDETTPDGDFFMKWCGVINPEGTSLEVTAGMKFLRVTAHDGLSLLNSIEYLQPDGSLWTDTPRLSQIVSRCLKLIPTSSLWGYNHSELETPISSSDILVSGYPTFFQESIHYYDTDKHAIFTIDGFTSTLYHTKVSSLTFYNTDRNSDRFEGEVLNTETVSCSEVLNSICQVFRARLYLDNGTWRFRNPKVLQNSATPNIHQWVTRNDMLSEPVDALASAADSDDLHITINNTTNYQYELLSGADESFLHPVKSTHSTHVKGGTQNLFDPLGNLMYTNIGATYIHTIANEDGTFSAFSTRTNPEFIFNAGDTPSIVGQARGFLNPNHNSVGGGSSSSTLHMGGHIIIDVEIKVGAYYLKGNTTFATQTQNIQRTAASDLTNKSILRDGVVEWTTVQSTYSIPCPNKLSSPDAMIATHEDDETEYVGGFHLAMNGNNNDEFKYSSGFMGSGGTEHDTSVFELAWTLPPLPAGTHTGATVKFSVRAFESDGTAITNATDLNNLRKQSTSGLVQLYNFKMLTGVDGSEIDAIYSNTQSENSQRLDVCSSLLGDQINGAALGSLQIEDVNSPGTWTYSNSNWASTKNVSATKYIHELNAIEGLQERGRSVKIRRGTIKSYEFEKTSSYIFIQKILPSFQSMLKFDDEVDDPVFIMLSMTHTAAPSIYDFVGYLDSVTPTITSDESNNKGDRGLLDNPPKPGLDFDSDVNGKNINGASMGTITKLNIARNNINSDSDGINSLTVHADGGLTPAVDLGEIHDVLAGNITTSTNYDDALAWFEMGAGVVDANRASQVGKNIVMIDDAGEMEETSPPTSTKYLQSTSAGAIKWQAPTFILSTLSGRASMYYAGRYYYGSSYYGFNFYSVSTGSSVITSINDQHANNGIVFPFSGTKINIKSLIRNDSGTNDVSIYLHTGSRPGGTSSNITLTEIGNVTAGCSAGQDLYFNADDAFTYAFSEGDLLFISYYRTGSNGTQYINFSHTISIQ
jgi:hypothetical protein